jgi:hypothetical protein
MDRGTYVSLRALVGNRPQRSSYWAVLGLIFVFSGLFLGRPLPHPSEPPLDLIFMAATAIFVDGDNHIQPIKDEG